MLRLIFAALLVCYAFASALPEAEAEGTDMYIHILTNIRSNSPYSKEGQQREDHSRQEYSEDPRCCQICTPGQPHCR